MKNLNAMFLRISREKNEDEDTLQNHREILEDYCIKNDIVYERYEEIISGGKDTLENRPQLKALLDNIEKYESIIVIDIDRLARNGLISQTIKKKCIDYDIKIITPSQTFDLRNNSSDSLLYDLRSAFAEYEYRNIAYRQKYNKKQRAKRGEAMGGIPYGYKKNPTTRKLEIFEEEAKIVRYIFQLHKEGLGSFSIRDRLNAEGIKAKRTHFWNLPSIKRIIRNPVYKGTMVWRDREKIIENGKEKYVTKEEVVVENAHPAIISVDEWELANIERKSRAEQFTRNRKKTVTFMLSDLVYCSVCGHKMVMRTEREKIILKKCEYLQRDGSKCTNCGVLIEYLEEEVLQDIKSYREQALIELEQLKMNDTSMYVDSLRTQLEGFSRELASVNTKHNNLIDLAINGVFSMEVLSEKKQELETNKQELETKIKSIQEAIESLDAESRINNLEHQIKRLDNFEELNSEHQNTILKKFYKKIVYTRVIPEDIRKLSTRNEARKYYPYHLEYEYLNR